MQEKTTPPSGSPPESPPGADREVVLEARRLTKHFPVRRSVRALRRGERPVVHAVDDVSLTLRRGAVTAVVGESGSGKSTVARLLARLYPLTSGELLLGGTAVPLRGGRSFRAHCRRVQMIFQDPFGSLNPVHTVRYHLTRSLRVHGRAGKGAAETERALTELLGRVHLTPASRYLDVFPHELSGGQRQRVAIARAMAADPEVLLADEPVSMLDVSIRLGILNLLRDLRDRLDLAILYITHDIASARYFADETLVMYAGRMVEGGDSETVTQRPAHPYTQLLVASAPDPDRITGTGVDVPVGESDAHATPAGRDLLPADTGAPVDTEDPLSRDRGTGEPPSLISPPAGCRFHPRCPFAMERCRTELPPRFDLPEPGHWAACWLHAPTTGEGEATGADAAAGTPRETVGPGTGAAS
ncbi:ATP-binding cassette domain-containing protein [Streptomyces alkaliphilus]|uniref:ATP-binding cassette domain-containing protein n=1 Tax=Streptomyces alkaliphilus TaxID=1472722 RepID=A0A7W3Y2T4_9ACTN|nr:ABC transporter ATP-binding protein [Streptomyces alkaliphilus]MBB0245695.1 ATP-binding cassette domain-containing protein [Streptomyces alkaliphilus]